jgi:thiamine-phosphate pyrophosphorylase
MASRLHRPGSRKPLPRGIYPILGDVDTGPSPIELAEIVLSRGVRLIQVRLKRMPTRELLEIARSLRRVTRRHDALLIINDRVDIARLVEADGVHLGQSDLPVAEARATAAGLIIGHSTHSLAQLEIAVREGGADYLAFGPVFATGSKDNPDPVVGLEQLDRARKICPLPLVAIGGISADNLAEVMATGADNAALISAISRADDPGQATAELVRIADSTVPSP